MDMHDHIGRTGDCIRHTAPISISPIDHDNVATLQIEMHEDFRRMFIHHTNLHHAPREEVIGDMHAPIIPRPARNG